MHDTQLTFIRHRCSGGFLQCKRLQAYTESVVQLFTVLGCYASQVSTDLFKLPT